MEFTTKQGTTQGVNIYLKMDFNKYNDLFSKIGKIIRDNNITKNCLISFETKDNKRMVGDITYIPETPFESYLYFKLTGFPDGEIISEMAKKTNKILFHNSRRLIDDAPYVEVKDEDDFCFYLAG